MHGKLSPFRSKEVAARVGRFYRAVLFEDEKAAEWCRKNGILIRAQNATSNTAGGYLVNDEGADAIISIAEKYGTFRAYAQPVAMGADTKHSPKRSAVPTTYYIAESDTVPASADLSFESVRLTTRTLATQLTSSNELADDSEANLAVEISTAAGEALALAEDQAGWNGDGTSSYGGQVGLATKLIDGTHNASAIDAASGVDQFSEITVADLVSLVGALPARALSGGSGAAWYCSQRAAALVFGRLGAAGGGLQWANGEWTFLTFPIRVSQALPQVTTALNNQLMLAFGNLFKAAMFGARKGITIDASRAGLSFEARQTQWLASERYNIVAHDLGDNTTPGAMLGLIGNT